MHCNYDFKLFCSIFTASLALLETYLYDKPSKLRTLRIQTSFQRHFSQHIFLFNYGMIWILINSRSTKFLLRCECKVTNENIKLFIFFHDIFEIFIGYRHLGLKRNKKKQTNIDEIKALRLQ